MQVEKQCYVDQQYLCRCVLVCYDRKHATHTKHTRIYTIHPRYTSLIIFCLASIDVTQPFGLLTFKFIQWSESKYQSSIRDTLTNVCYSAYVLSKEEFFMFWFLKYQQLF